MSTFNIYQNLEYAVMLADSLGLRETPGGNISPLLAPKLACVLPGVYAAHAGYWQPALAMLHEVRRRLVEYGKNVRYEQFIEVLSQVGSEICRQYRELWQRDVIDVRIALVVTGAYRSPIDVEKGVSTTLIIWETARGFVPERAAGRLCWAVNPETSAVMSGIMELPAMAYLLKTGPLSVAQALEAVHALIARISTSVSLEANIAVVGAEEEFSVLKGQMISLPNRAITLG